VLSAYSSDISLANQKFHDALPEVAAQTIEYNNGHAFTFGRPIVLEQSVWIPHCALAAPSSTA